MQEPQALNSVAAFHQLFDAPIEMHPIIPASDRCDLRVRLLQEELNELKEAIAQNDIVEVADALCDLQYVLSGAILEFGLGAQFKDLFDEVQRSNMSKACATEEEAIATAKYYQTEKNTPCEIVQKGRQFMVYRKSDNKVLKSINYSPAQLKVS